MRSYEISTEEENFEFSCENFYIGNNYYYFSGIIDEDFSDIYLPITASIKVMIPEDIDF